MNVQRMRATARAGDHDLVEHATALHLAQPGAQQPDEGLSSVETSGTRKLVVLRNVSGVLSVYRVLRDDILSLVARVPKGLRQ